MRTFLEISRPDSLDDIADLGLTLADARLVLAGVQREIVAAQARVHAARRPACRSCGTACRVKDIAGPCDRHAVRPGHGAAAPLALRRLRYSREGVAWPPYARSTPELDRLQAQFSALMTYRTAAEVLAQMFPVDAGTAHETLRRHTFKLAERLSMPATAQPAPPAERITLTLDSTFIRSCEDGERHLAIRIGNVETATGCRQVFGAVAKTETGLAALIRGNLDAVGRTRDTALTAFTDGSGATHEISLA